MFVALGNKVNKLLADSDKTWKVDESVSVVLKWEKVQIFSTSRTLSKDTLLGFTFMCSPDLHPPQSSTQGLKPFR